MLGNLGFSSVKCSLGPFQFSKMGLSCSYGQIGNIVAEGVGINEANLRKRDFCQVTRPSIVNYWIEHRDLSIVKEGSNAQCSDLLDKQRFNEMFASRCQNQKSCEFTISELKALVS